jgi:ATP-GRASP peptide maturase of grasp-with-spasm system
MILIISDSYDFSTNDVIDWLKFLGGKFIRVNGIDTITDKPYCVTFETTSISSHELDDSNIKAIWYRRWYQSRVSENIMIEEDNILQNDINRYLNREFNSSSKAFFSKLKSKNWLNCPDDAQNDKFFTLKKAKEIGLNVPETIITNSKKELISFIEKNKQIIVKSLSEPTFFKYNEQRYGLYTTVLNYEDIIKMENFFFPSLFQKKIEKQFELRVFYLEKKCYSMAIFSQNNDRTAIDFRVYDRLNPNRTVPFNLPKDIEFKIEKLMLELNINCGSIDIIKSVEGEYIFLEVNPVGQFGMTSYPCNYNLEKKIANYLLTKSNEDSEKTIIEN